MRLVVCTVGRLKAGPERELSHRYVERAVDLAGKLGLSGPDLVEIPESRARDAPTRRREEWAALAARAGPRTGSAARIVLDERGRALATAEFAERIRQRRDEGTKTLAFILGGADGLDAAARETPGDLVSFGAMTLPHQLARIVLVEQIYRALTLHLGHPYHRA